MTSSALKLAACATALLVQGTDWTPARPDYRWSFPADHYAHPGYKTEWWYVTGHLEDTADPARRFGYQFTFFKVGLLRDAPPVGSDWAAQSLVMGHAAVTDLAGAEHHFSETLYRAIPLLGGFGAPGDSLVAWSRGPAGTEERWTLRWADSGFAFTMADRRAGIAFDLATAAEKPLVLQGPNGYSRKGDGPTAASQYYSFTRLRTAGTLTVGGRTYRVRGTSWMDKEFGSNQLAPDQVGWDWFSLQLHDGRELMLYLLRDATGATDFASGTIVPRSGTPRYVERGAFSVRATADWTSADGRTTYPARWRIEVPGEDLRLEVLPLVADQENVSRILPALRYWEGAVAVRDAAGREVGRGYVELAGYGRGVRLPL